MSSICYDVILRIYLQLRCPCHNGIVVWGVSHEYHRFIYSWGDTKYFGWYLLVASCVDCITYEYKRMKYFMVLVLLLLSGCNCKNLSDVLSSGCYFEQEEQNECVDCESLNTPVRIESD